MTGEGGKSVASMSGSRERREKSQPEETSDRRSGCSNPIALGKGGGAPTAAGYGGVSSPWGEKEVLGKRTNLPCWTKPAVLKCCRITNKAGFLKKNSAKKERET